MKETSLSSVRITLLVLLGGIFFAWLLWHEYRENRQLIEHNKALLNAAIRKNIISTIEDKTQRYPDKAAELIENWSRYRPDIYWFSQGRQVFPFVFRGTAGASHWSELWSAYSDHSNSGSGNGNNTSGDSNGPHLEEETGRRIELVRLLRRAVERGEDEAIRRGLAEFLLHKQHYRLAPLEEIVSSLSLLELAGKQRWRPQFVRDILLDGWPTPAGKIASIAEIMLRRNETLSRQDFDRIYQKVREHAEKANLSITTLAEYVEAFASPISLPRLPERGVWIFNQKWLVITRPRAQHLLLPFSPFEEATAAERRLKERGLLDSQDSINVFSQSDWQPLEALGISVAKPSWQQARNRQNYYFALKCALLVSLVVLILLAQRSLQLQVQRKQSFLKMKEDFVNIVSHELKTPLASIRLMAETLKIRLEKQLEPKDYPQRILNESDRMDIMVDNILSFRRFQANGFELNREAIELKAFIEHIGREYCEICDKEMNMAIGIDPAVKAYLDPNLFSLVIRNLLSNASKYNDNERVTIGVSYHAESASVFVRDNGVGIAREKWQQVFTEFYRDKHTSSVPGTGLGLALSKRIMAAHGGNLSISGSDENGTCWQLCLG